MSAFLEQQSRYQNRGVIGACVLFLLFGLLCLFCPGGVWKLILMRLWVREDGAPSSRCVLAIRITGAVFVLLSVFLLISL